MKKKNGKKFFNFLKRNYLFLILILVLCFSFFGPVMNAYYRKVDIDRYKELFENSKYDKKILELESKHQELFKLFGGYIFQNNTSESILLRDSDLYVYKSYLYIMGVINPITALGLFHQNLPNIFIGLSLLIFHTPHAASIIIGLACLYMVYILSQLLLNNRTLSIIITGLFCLDPTFKYQLLSPLLDIYLCLFILLSFYFSLKILDAQKKRYYIFLALSLGCALSVKQWIGLFLVLFILIYFLVIKHFQDFKRILIHLPLSLLVYIIIEWPFFIFLKRVIFSSKIYGWKIIKSALFFRIKSGQGSNVVLYPFEIFKVMFTGTWFNLCTDTRIKIYNPFFIIFFSLTSFFSVYYILKNKKRKEKPRLVLFYAWMVLYCLVFTFKRVHPWYLIEILPMIYILGCFTCYNLIINNYRKLYITHKPHNKTWKREDR